MRDLVRAREAPRRISYGARHRLSKFCCARGSVRQRSETVTQAYLGWVKQVHFTQAARESTLLDFYTRSNTWRSGEAVGASHRECGAVASPQMQEVARGLQHWRRHCAISR